MEGQGFFSNITNVLSLILTFVGAGGLGWVIGIKSKKKQQEAEANQEAAKADTLTLTNVNEVINLYKKALQDMKEFKDKDAEEYIKKISEYERKMQSYDKKLRDYEADLEEKNRKIEELTKSQLKLKLELDEMRENESIKCENCQYKKVCEQLDKVRNESTDK